MPISVNPTPFPIDYVVRIKRTNEFAIVRHHTFLHEGFFMHYLLHVEDRNGLYCYFHDDLELECLP
jgi:hypothetical protein